MKRATIQDVAAAAGVSITTVSRVINDNYPVKASTRKKVEEAIDLLINKPDECCKVILNFDTKA